jgi:DNA replication protein DnaC
MRSPTRPQMCACWVEKTWAGVAGPGPAEGAGADGVRVVATDWEAGESLILYGPVGVGNTYIAQAVAQLAIRAGHRGPVQQARPRAGRARPAATPTAPEPTDCASSPAPLVLDEFAMRELTVPDNTAW